MKRKRQKPKDYSLLKFILGFAIFIIAAGYVGNDDLEYYHQECLSYNLCN